MTATKRQYAGHSAQERAQQRRGRLIEAAIRVYGAQGYGNATVKAVCEAAGLTERYFYESFSNSEALLMASFDTVTHRVLSRLDEIRAVHEGDAQARARAVLRAYYQMLKDNPDGARLFVIEIPRYGLRVDEALAVWLREFGELLSRTLAPERSPSRKSDQLLRVGAVGAVMQIAKSWIRGGYVQGVAAVAEDALLLCSAMERARVTYQ